MSPNRWKQIQDVFHAVLERDPRERSAAIAELCSDDAELRDEVESLLSSSESDEQFLRKPAFDAKAVATEISGETRTGERNSGLAGTTIDHYEVISLLGAGGMGEVYRARDQRLGREVALKILCDTGPPNDSLVRRFEYEVRAVAAFNHPNICHLYDVGFWSGRPFFTMELLDGRTLRDHIGASPLPVSELLTFGIQIASALSAAHAKGILHRDIKPANIFVTSQGPLKVMDFGLAKRAALDSSSNEPTWSGARTMPGAAMGTIAYMSPEQARALDLDARTDLFSFGVVLYEMATGVQPFRGSTSAVVFDAILNQIPEPPSRLNPEISPELDRIILTALEKDREIRFQSAAEMRATLKRLQRSLDTPATAQIYAPAVSKPAVRPDEDSARGLRSLAVLPFEFLHGGREGDEYLGLGLADALITRMSGARRLIVRPTSSVYKYAGRHSDPQTAGRELGVTYTIGGLIRRSGDQMRITVHLVNVRTGAQLWAGQIDQTFTTLLALEDALARLAAEALVPRLNAEERELLGTRDTDNPEAWEAYMRGRFHRTGYSAESMAQALVCFMDAIAKDPNYSRAWAAVADYYNWAGAWNVLPPAESFKAAMNAATRAISLNPDLPEGQTAWAYSVWNNDWDWDTAERAFRRALDLNDSYAFAHNCLAFLLSARGRHAEAIAAADRALALDPLAPGVAAGRCLILYYAREIDQACEAARTAISVTGANPTMLSSYAWIASAKRMHADAIGNARRAAEASDSNWVLATLAAVLASAGEETEARRHLAQLTARAETLPICRYDLALIHVALRDQDAAIACLEESAASREWWIRFIAVDWRFEPLSQHPAFKALCAKVAAPPQSPGRLLEASRPPAPVPPRYRVPRKLIWAALVFVIIAGAIGWWQFANRPDSFFHAPQFTKITTSGNATAAAISPDGHYVAYALDEAGKFSLWVRQVSIANGVRILPESRSIFRGLTFSRDGAYIYYVIYDNNLITRGSLYRVPTLGGTPTKVADEVSGAVSLSPDNRREAFLRSDFRTGIDELIVGEVDGARQTRIAARKYPQHFAYSSAPAWSPDGQMIAIASENTDKLGFYVSVVGVRLKDRAEKVLSKRRWQYVEQMSWLPDNRGILLVGKDQEASFQQIWHITSPVDEPRRLTRDLNDYYGISVSANSQAIVSAQSQMLTNVWELSRSGASRRITPGYGRYFDLSLAPANAIAYASDASGSADIWAMDRNGGSQRQLTSSAHRNYSPSVSPDGNRIAFHSNRTGTWNIWTMNTDGGDLQQLTSDANDSNWPMWTPDGKYLVYHHIASAGYQTIWKIPSTGGTPVQITDRFSLRPAVSPKDGTVACWYTEQPANPKWELAILPPNGGPPLKTFPMPSTTSVESMIRWTPDGRGIAWIDEKDGVSNILVQTIDGAPPRQITNFNSDRIFSFDWSKSGDLVYSRGLRTNDIVLITDAR